jgi:septal ring factor EnvC (AmiA/AmiB activator)
MSLENLKLLESKIEEFLGRHERVRQEHDALQQQLRQQEKQLTEAMSQLKQYEKERGEMRTRLQRILGRLKDLNLA